MMGFIDSTEFIASTATELALVAKERSSILAGNSRLDVGADASIKVEAQILAFKNGLLHAHDIRRETGSLPFVSIAFDHKGIFRRHFLRDGLSNSQKRNPRLSHLRQEIVEVFKPSADELDIPIDHILVIHEDSARTHAEHLLSTMPMPEAVRHRMAASPVDAPVCGVSGGGKITCAAITSEYFCKAAGADDTSAFEQAVLDVYFELSPWSEVSVYVRGLQLAHALGMKFGIRLNLVTPDGMVQRGELIRPVT